MKITLLFGALCLLLSASALAAGGLVVEFDKDTPSSEIEAFTSQYRSIANARQADEKIVAKAQAARGAMNGGRGHGPERPARPNISGMAPREAKTLMDGYQSDLVSYDNFQQNTTNGKNNDANASSNSRNKGEAEQHRPSPHDSPPAHIYTNSNTGGMQMDTGGTFYMDAGGGNMTSTKDGTFMQKAAGGYIDTRTGQFVPSI